MPDVNLLDWGVGVGLCLKLRTCFFMLFERSCRGGGETGESCGMSVFMTAMTCVYLRPRFAGIRSWRSRPQWPQPRSSPGATRHCSTRRGACRWTVSPFIRAPAAVPRPNNSFARIGYTTAAPLAKLPASPALCCQDIFQELGVKDKLPQRGGRAAVMQETDKQVR